MVKLFYKCRYLGISINCSAVDGFFLFRIVHANVKVRFEGQRNYKVAKYHIFLCFHVGCRCRVVYGD